MTTRESYIQSVRQAVLGLAVLDPAERDTLAGLKLVYGSGSGTGARGVTYFSAWKKGPAPASCSGPVADDTLIEICAFAEESLVQLCGTTIHEMAHALAGRTAGHGKNWSVSCKRLGLRGMRAAGTAYVSAMFVPRLREVLAALPIPDDGKVINWNGTVSGFRLRPCSAGIGARGGRSRGPGSGSRLRRFTCACEPPVIVRAARDTLPAHCDLCAGPFVRS